MHGPHPLDELEPAAGASIAVLAGRATHMPQAGVTSGVQRTVTVSSRRALHWVPVPDLGWGSGPQSGPDRDHPHAFMQAIKPA
jgi:hypothetical protein